MSTPPQPPQGLPDTPRDLASNLILASRMITSARDDADMARSVLYTIAQPMTAVSLTRLDMSDDRHVRSRSILALVTADGTCDIDPAARADLLPSTEQLDALRHGLPVIVDLDRASALTRRELEPLRVTWAASFALRSEDDILGTLDVLHTQPCRLTTAETDAFTVLADQIGAAVRSRRLLHEARLNTNELGRQVRQLQIMNRLAAAIGGAADEQTILDNGCRALVDVTGLDHSSIALLSPDKAASEVVSEYPPGGAVGIQIPLVDNPVYEAVRDSRQPLVIHDVTSDPRLPLVSRQALQHLGVHAMLVIPLLASDRLVGSLGLDAYTPDKPITPEVVDTALAVAAQASLGLQNLRLLAQAQRQANQLQRIAAFSQSAQATLDVTAVFQNMLAETSQMLAQDQMSIMLYDPAHGALRIAAEHADGQTSVSAGEGDIIPVSGHIAQVWDSGELLHISDLHQERERSRTGNGLRSWILAPVIIHGRTLGLVSIGSVRPNVYTDTDVALFQQMVTQLAVAIENTEAYAQSQRMVRNESLLNNLSTQLQAQTDLEHMMELTASHLGSALGARRARIRFGVPDSSS